MDCVIQTIGDNPLIFTRWMGFNMPGRLIVLSIISIILGMVVITSGMFSVFVVSGESMEPLITDDDLILFAKLTPEKLNVGDIIAFRPHHGDGLQGPFVAHRIVAIDEAGHITTKGDNVGFADSYDIYPSDVIGRVALILPGAGAVMRVAMSVYGYAVLVLIPSLWLIANELRHLRGWRARH